jgi:hypothetical protein
LYIVDPNLKNLVGHYFEYDASVARGVEACGYQPILLARSRVDPAIGKRVGAIPAFAEDIWGTAPRGAGKVRIKLARFRSNALCLAVLLRNRRGAPRGPVVFAHTFIAMR